MSVNILLIDRFVRDYNVFVTSVNSSTLPIVYSNTTTRRQILSQLSDLTTIDRIGIAFSNEGNTLFLENGSFFGDNMNFIISLIQEKNVKNIDYLGCNTLNTPGWKEYYAILTEQTGVIVGASSNRTGNLQYGGDWILESTGQDIEHIYFTQSIEYYKYLLDSNRNDNTIVIHQNNTIYCVGDTTYGQLGLGYSSYVNNLTLIPNITKTPKSISCGYEHTVIVMTDGTMYGTGKNVGSLANISQGSTFRLMTNPVGKTPTSVSCGSAYTIVLMSDGTLYGGGINSYGEIANVPSLGSSFALITTPVGKTPTSVSCGEYHTFVLMTDNTVYATGNNQAGQLGLGNTNNQSSLQLITMPSGKTPKTISCGSTSTIILMTDGTIYGTGENYNGELANITTGSSFQLMTMPLGKTPKAISCSFYHTVILMTDNTLYSTGQNSEGQLGLGNTTNQSSLQLMTNSSNKTPASITCGGSDTFILMTDGSIYSVGRMLIDFNISTSNTISLITNSTTKTPNVLFPIVVSMNNNLSNISSIGSNRISSIRFIVLMTDNSIYGMGFGGFIDKNSIGIDTNVVSTFNSVNINNTPKYITNGYYHTVVLMSDGSLYGSGYNHLGQLANLPTVTSSFQLITTPIGKTAKAVACCDYNTAVLMTDGTIYGTGENYNGQLANITTGSSFQLITTPVGKTPASITCGYSHTIVLMTDGTVYGTGINYFGELANITTGTSFQLMTMPLGKSPSAAVCSNYCTFILMTDGTVYSTGVNGDGQLGLGNTTNQSSLQLMTFPFGKTAVAVSCGHSHTIVLMTDGTVYGTGYNGLGQLGLSNSTDQTSLQLMTIPSGKTASAVSCGYNHTTVLMTDGTVYGTGYNLYGQLGLGNIDIIKTSLQLVPNLTSVNKLASSDISIIPIYDYVNNGNVVCFKEGSLILTDKGYLPIEQLQKGTLVRTLLHGFVPIDMIGKREIYHAASKNRIKDQLYICTNDAYPEVFEPLVITGCHSILIDEFIDGQRELVNAFNGGIYITDNQYRLPACVDPRAKVYDKQGTYTIYHIALENNDYYLNYGIYANGLLVETCSKRYLKELSNMEII